MTIAARLTALERAATAATDPRCPDPFHHLVDYRDVIRTICPPDMDLPPTPLCPTCAGERLAGLPVRIVAVDYADAVAGVIRPAGGQEEVR